MRVKKKMKNPQNDILFIMDDKDNLNLLESYFGAKYPEIVCKSSRGGVGILEEIHKNPPKVIVLYIYLPYMSGYDICKHVKSNPNLKHISVIYFTTRYDEYVKSKVEDTGADGYILMPVKFSDLDVIVDLLN